MRGHLLAGEHVAGDLAPEALEPALRVLDGADDPDRGQQRGTSCPAPAASRLRRPHVRAVRLDPGCRRRRRRLERVDEQRRARRAAWPCRRRRTRRRRRWRRACRPDGRALAAVGDGQELELAGEPSPGAPGRARAVPSAPAVVDDEDVDRVRQPSAPGAAVAARSPRRCEVAEQLVERRAEPRLLVVGGQDDCERPGGHRGQSMRNGARASVSLCCLGRRDSSWCLLSSAWIVQRG